MLFGLLADKPRRRKQAPSVPPFGPEWCISGGPSVSGEFVTPDRAMREATVAACVRILAESVAQLPMKVFQGEGADTVEHGPLVDLLRYPNAWQDSFQFREYMMVCLCLRGNFYARMTRDRNGNVRELLPLHPESVSARLRNWEPVYAYTDSLGRSEECGPDMMLHVRGESLDGIVGFSPIGYHRNTIGLSLATEAHGGRIFRNGARPGGILTHPSKLSDEALEHLRQSWAASHGGENAGGTAILEEGMDFKPVAMTNEDAQYLETRKFQRGLICGIFRVPPHMVADLEKATFSNIEHQSIEFAKYSILPWAVRIETALMRHLLSKEQREQGLRIRLVLDGLERADIKTRYESYSIAIQNGIMSPNECRRLENRNPREGGDVFLQPLNMTDSSHAGDAGAVGAVREPPLHESARSLIVPQPADSVLAKDGFRDAAVGAVREPPLHTAKAASDEDDEDDDEHDHDDWADGEWSEESADLNQIMRDFRPKLEKMYREIVAKEVAEIRKLVDKFFPETEEKRYTKASEAEFSEALRLFYAGLKPQLSNTCRPLYAELAGVVVAMAANQELGNVRTQDLLKHLQSTVKDFADIEAADYVERSLRQLQSIVDQKENVPAVLRRRLEAWEAKRARKVSANAAVYGPNWYARECYGKAGVEKIKWVANGAKTCPFCRRLNGTIVGIKGHFVGKGQTMDGDTNHAPLTPKRKVLHPPIHRGCVCAIVPVIVETTTEVEKRSPIAGVEPGPPMTHEESIALGTFNPDTNEGYKHMNCPFCVIAYAARRAGYDVQAWSDAANFDILLDLAANPGGGWIDPKTGVAPKLGIGGSSSTNKEQFLKYLESNIEKDAIYILRYMGEDNDRWVSGHVATIYRDNDNVIKVYDPWDEYSSPITEHRSIDRILYKSKRGYDISPSILRVDNLLLNIDIANKILKRRV